VFFFSHLSEPKVLNRSGNLKLITTSWPAPSENAVEDHTTLNKDGNNTYSDSGMAEKGGFSR
jgi:hypothetical protein